MGWKMSSLKLCTQFCNEHLLPEDLRKFDLIASSCVLNVASAIVDVKR